MKMIKTDFHKNINRKSSYIIYITKTLEEAQGIHKTALSMKDMHSGWYYSVSTCEVLKDCRVPTFFHDRGYYMTAVEHNNGDWDKKPTYTLYIVE